jgi:hypothetical protein
VPVRPAGAGAGGGVPVLLLSLRCAPRPAPACNVRQRFFCVVPRLLALFAPGSGTRKILGPEPDADPADPTPPPQPPFF